MSFLISVERNGKTWYSTDPTATKTGKGERLVAKVAWVSKRKSAKVYNTQDQADQRARALRRFHPDMQDIVVIAR